MALRHLLLMGVQPDACLCHPRHSHSGPARRGHQHLCYRVGQGLPKGEWPRSLSPCAASRQDSEAQGSRPSFADHTPQRSREAEREDSRRPLHSPL